MKIYVASLSDYNAGVIHGAWFDLADYNDDEELYAAIESQVLETSPTAHAEGLDAAEEYAIHDYDDIRPSGLGEYESLSNLMEIQDCFSFWIFSQNIIHPLNLLVTNTPSHV